MCNFLTIVELTFYLDDAIEEEGVQKTSSWFDGFQTSSH